MAPFLLGELRKLKIRTKYMKFTKLGVLSVVATIAGLQGVSGKDITIFDKVDGNGSNPGSVGWAANGIGAAKEDNETEPGTAVGQEWDLEAFHLNGNKLQMIGGFDFLGGEDGNASGDIFIDVNGDAVWGTSVGPGGNQTVSNSVFKYDYVIHFTGRTDQTISGNYEVYSLTSSANETTVTFNSNDESNPWIYLNGGTLVTTGTATQAAYSGTEYSGSSFVFGDFDLSFLSASQLNGALFKFTMECGNDNLIGHNSVPDGGATVFLMGTGLTALGLLRRRIAR
jgi:hypothetical protein